MESLPPIEPPAIVRSVAADPTVVPADVVDELNAWLDAKDAAEREEIENQIDQMEAAEMQDDPGRLQFDSML